MCSSSCAVEELTVWQAQLRDFASRCAASGLDDERPRVREASELVEKAPKEIRRQYCGLRSKQQFNKMNFAGGYESAVIHLFGADIGYMISRSCDGTCIASVFGPAIEKEITVEGRTPALALLEAYAYTLIYAVCSGG